MIQGRESKILSEMFRLNVSSVYRTYLIYSGIFIFTSVH